MKSLFILVLGITLGGYCMHLYDQNENKPKEVLIEQMKKMHVSADEVRVDLVKTGEVVRDKAASAGVGLTDARILAVIKGKFLLDHDLSAADIQIEVDHSDVTLKGHVASEALLNKAVSAAMDTEGVHHLKAQLFLK
ncbi:MAG: BON domain-containing protein [Verrucomicrobiota bacterium]|jgi:osmotically-inducible protein OsmY|nr:MAG: BON domain-containing protein [Verrucomicrobiota bacterium]